MPVQFTCRRQHRTEQGMLRSYPVLANPEGPAICMLVGCPVVILPNILFELKEKGEKKKRVPIFTDKSFFSSKIFIFKLSPTPDVSQFSKSLYCKQTALQCSVFFCMFVQYCILIP